MICVLLKRYPEALEHFRAAAILEPDSLEAQVNLCAAALRTGRIDDAVRALSAVKRINPGHPKIAALERELAKVKNG